MNLAQIRIIVRVLNEERWEHWGLPIFWIVFFFKNNLITNIYDMYDQIGANRYIPT